MFPSLMKFYCNRIVDALIVNNIENVYISNDHSGDIYIISIILRKFLKSLFRIYNMAQLKRVSNKLFDEIYVYDEKYAEIYKNLC